MSERQFRIMLVAEPGIAADDIFRELQGDGATVIPCGDADAARAEITARRVHAVALLDNGNAHDAALLIEFIRANPASTHIPLFLVRNPGARGSSVIPFGADGILEAPPQTEMHGRSGAMLASVLRHLRTLYHPVTFLQTGAILHNALESETRQVEKVRHLLLIKLMGLKAYNVYKNYEAGDSMLASFADLLQEAVVERDAHNDIIGHLHGSKFCLLSHDRRVETLCRSLIVKTQRHIRTFYTPFELMQGFITVEDEGSRGNYYLAEAMIAGAEIPTGWDSPHTYILDMLDELMQQVERENAGHKLISL
jgi:GGDEF domain-containing protein